MADLVEFPDKIPGAKDVAITLNGTEWMSVLLKISGRPLGAVHRTALTDAEVKIFQALGKEV